MTETPTLRRRFLRRMPSPIQEFLATETSGGVVLLLAAVIALVWANSPWSDSYFELWEEHFRIGIGGFEIDESLHAWVNDALMAIFFFVVGLEIKRELVTGELRDPRTAALPVVAAFGGMLVPAALFAAFNFGGDGSGGWGVPMATDIAFAVGVLALLGDRVPRTLKLFLLTLAIADDLGAILVIAVFYTSDMAPAWLGGAALVVGAILVMQQLGVRRPSLYVLPALLLWYCMFESGVHATIAGVLTGLLTPARPFRERSVIPPLERALHPWSSFVILPLFALANAGVRLSGDSLDRASSSMVTVGVFVGLVVGKTIGVSAATWIGVRLGVGRMPRGVTWFQLVGVAALAGIGFTVALFVAELSFEGDLLDDAKIGILAASLTAGVLGSGLLVAANRRADGRPGATGEDEPAGLGPTVPG